MQHSWLLCTLEGSSVKCPFAQQPACLCPHNTYPRASEPSITTPPWNSSTVRKWHKKLHTSCSLIILIGNKNLSDIHGYLTWLSSGEQTSLWRYLNIPIIVSKFQSSCSYLRRSLGKKKQPSTQQGSLTSYLFVITMQFFSNYIVCVYLILIISYLLSG